MNNRVICGICKNQTGGFCAFKKSKVRTNKRRVCDKFVKDAEKVKISTPMPIYRRPELFWDRNERRRLLKEYKKLLENKSVPETQEIEMVNLKRDVEHPLTGDLSRFVSTATEDTEEKE